MENKLDNFLKNKLSVDELEISSPDLSLINEAREKIRERKLQDPAHENFFDRIVNYFNAQLRPLQVGFAALLVIASVFYFINAETSSKQGSFMSQNATTNYSISTSTVLASLTQYTNNKTATSSSTVLTSIITFVVRN